MKLSLLKLFSELDENRFNAEDYADDFDWGDSWASFDEFEMALNNLKEKSNGFQMLIHDICDADSKYAKAMRKLASNHLTAYQRTHGKMAEQAHAEHTKHQAMKSLLETVNRVADHHELLSWSVNTFMENEFKAKLADANDKLHGISSANKKMKKDLNFQLGRVKAAKNEYNKRVSDLEQAESNYQKYQDERDEANRDIKDMDKLRVKVADKHALVTRAQEEHDQQVIAADYVYINICARSLPTMNCRNNATPTICRHSVDRKRKCTNFSLSSGRRHFPSTATRITKNLTLMLRYGKLYNIIEHFDHQMVLILLANYFSELF